MKTESYFHNQPAVSEDEFLVALAKVKLSMKKTFHFPTRQRVGYDQFRVALAKVKLSLARKSGLFRVIIFFLTGCTPAIAMPLLDAIAMVESSNNPNAIGDGGRATGAWQMHKAARIDARRYLGRDGTDRELAGALLNNLNLRLHRELKRSPAPSDSYAAWNLGLSGYRSRGFLLSNCPKITQRAAARVERMTW